MGHPVKWIKLARNQCALNSDNVGGLFPMTHTYRIAGGTSGPYSSFLELRDASPRVGIGPANRFRAFVVLRDELPQLPREIGDRGKDAAR